MLVEAYQLVEQSIRGDDPLPVVMSRLVDFCRSVDSSVDWKSPSGEELTSDVHDLTGWLSRLLKSEPAGPEINGLWFGLFPSSPTYGFYVCGSKRFDPNAEDWACSPDYFPDDGYADSRILNELGTATSAVVGDMGGAVAVALCLGYAGILVRDWARWSMRSELLGRAALRGVGIGFDDGDAILIDILTP